MFPSANIRQKTEVAKINGKYLHKDFVNRKFLRNFAPQNS